MSNKMNKYEELVQKSKTHQYMHSPGGKPDDLNDSKNNLHSVHQRGKQRTTWYYSSWKTMRNYSTPTNPELVTYEAETYPYTHLHRSLLTTVTPSIKASDGYEIRFCDDLFMMMVKEFKLQINEVELQCGNRKSLFCQLKTNKQWKKYSTEVGNKESLTSWSNEIYEEAISVYLPWFYARDKSDSFPLKYCGREDKLHHIIEYNLDLSNLLLIRKADSGELVEFDMKLLTVSGNREKIDIPEMEGLYASLTSKENVDYHEFSDENKDGEKELYTESVYYIEDENKVELGKKASLKIPGSYEQPITQIYWGTINSLLTEKSKTLKFDIEVNGRKTSPVKVSKLEDSLGVIVDNKSSYKTERGYLLPYDKNYYPDSGVSCYSNNVLINEDGRKLPNELLLNEGKLTITMKDRNILRGNNKFLAFAVLVYVNKFKFKSYPKNEEERLKIGCVVELEE